MVSAPAGRDAYRRQVAEGVAHPARCVRVVVRRQDGGPVPHLRVHNLVHAEYGGTPDDGSESPLFMPLQA